MNREQAAREITGIFLRIVNKYNAMEKIPVGHGRKGGLYHSERHMLDAIADRPELNISEHAAALGVTKGAISQVVKKLEGKGFVRRYKKGGNDKAVYLEMTKQGKDMAERRKRVNQETLGPLVRELKRRTDKEIDSLIAMFRWIDGYLEESRKKMGAHSGKR